MERKCRYCVHSIGVGQRTVRHLITHRGYRDQCGPEHRGESIICEPRRVVNSLPCDKFEREVGADDE